MAPVVAGVLRRLIFGLDALLRRLYGIHEFTEESDCLFRISTTISRAAVNLPPDVVVSAGDKIGELHFWNEHLPQIGPAGADLTWARQFQRQVKRSLSALAAYLPSDPDYQDVVAFRGRVHAGQAKPDEMLARSFQHWGFAAIDERPPRSRLQSFTRFWRNFYIQALIWAYNAGSLRGKAFGQIHETEVWISRQELLQRYGPAPVADPPPLAVGKAGR